MPIYHSLKAIFIHIPKAGGTSIEETISDFPLFRQKLVNKYNWYGNIKHQNNQQTYELDHSTMAYLKNNCKYYDNNYFIFSVIRNPYARLVSEYHYCKYQYSRLIKNLNTFNDFVYELKEKFDYIILDAYSNTINMPQQLLTQEFLYMVKSKLNNKSLFIFNAIANPQFKDAFSIKLDNTLQKVFGNINRQIINPKQNFNKTVTNIIYSYYNNKVTTQKTYSDLFANYFLDH